MHMESIQSPNQTAQLLRNSLVVLVATVLTVGLWMLWWPLALGMAWGGFNELVDSSMPKWKRYSQIGAMVAFVGAVGFFAGTVGVAIVSFVCYMVLVLKIK